MRKILVPTLSLLFFGGIIFNLTSCKPKLDPGFTFTQDGLTVVFTNTSEVEVDEYYWDFGDGNTSNEKSPTYTFAGAGTYIVTSGLIRGDDQDEVYQNVTVQTDIQSGGLTIYIQRKGTDNPLNSNAGFALIGRSKDDMMFNRYEANKRGDWEIQKPIVVDPTDLLGQEWFIDSAYSQKGKGTFPNTEKEAAPIIFSSLPTGTYYVHAFDGSLAKAVGSVQIEANKVNTVIFETQALGQLKIITAQSGVAGSELDSIEVRLYGTSNDTFKAVAKSNMSEIQYEPYFSGRSSSQINELKQVQRGTLYFLDVPAGRKYLAIAYSEIHATTDGTQANEEILIKANFLKSVRLTFK